MRFPHEIVRGVARGRRPGAGHGRRSGFRGIGGGGAPAFDPLDDPDLVGLWLPATGSATDNGTDLTVPNLVAGGAALIASGVGRPTISATALDGYPGIVTTGANVPLKAAITLAGKSQATIYIMAYESAQTTAWLWEYGNGGNQSMTCLSHVSAGFNIFSRATSGGTPSSDSAPLNGSFASHPAVGCFRYNGARTTLEQRALTVDGLDATATYVDINTTGNLSVGPLTVGNRFSGSGPYAGVIGAVAVVGREHTDAEEYQWRKYLQALVGLQSVVRVMWTGDSVTAGGGGGTATWRRRVDTLFNASGGRRWYQQVGPVVGASSPTFTHDRANAGGGQRLDTQLSLLSTYFIGGSNRRIYAEVIPIMLGTNDIAVSGVANSVVRTRYDAYLDALSARLPSALLIAQKILPRVDGFAAQVVDWNANWHDAMVAAAVGRGINVISDDTLATLPGITYADGVHPSSVSSDMMGDAIYPALQGWCGV
jgi:lysophospholipase L1-like esterase